MHEIRARLIARSAAQRNGGEVREWDIAIIRELLHAEDYTGRATWTFADLALGIDIPAIVPRELWERVQARMERNRKLPTRNTAGGVYLLQDLLYCGECGAKVLVKRIRYFYKKQADGTNKRHVLKTELHEYRCTVGNRYYHEHPRPAIWTGAGLDYAVWRYLVDHAIKPGNVIKDQVLARQARLQEEGDHYDGELATAHRKLAAVQGERDRYSRQEARGIISLQECEARMAETEEYRAYWQGEIKRLTDLRDNAAKVKAGIDYTYKLLDGLRERLEEIDVEPDALRALPEERRQWVLRERQKVVRALVDKIVVWVNGEVKIEGVLDGSELAQLNLGDSCSRRRSWR
jgi:hypothetical protein